MISIYKYFGVAAFLSLSITIFLGFNIKRYGIKKHKFFAILTGIFAVIHLILQNFNL